jgi:hypothetical protein
MMVSGLDKEKKRGICGLAMSLNISRQRKKLKGTWDG